MSRQYQDPNYNYQTPYSNPSQQPGQFTQPSVNTYNDRPGQQAYSAYSEGSLQPQQPSGQRHGSHSPYAGTVPFPETQHGSSASHPQGYIPPTQNLTVPTHHQHERRGSHGHSPATGSSSDSQRLYPAYAGGGSNIYSPQPGVQPHHGGGYTATVTAARPQDHSPQPGVQPHHGGGYTATVTAARPQDRNATVYDEGHDSRSKAPPYRPTGTTNSTCRYPHCRNPVFFDRRVDELREWCNDQHMLLAITHGVEKACKDCGVWPRRNGYKRCSGNICRY